MLDSSHTQLIAIYPKFEMRIFMGQMELLSDELQEKVLFRMPNKRENKRSMMYLIKQNQILILF